MKDTKVYFNNIEFLRFIMIIGIIMFHLFFKGSILLLTAAPPPPIDYQRLIVNVGMTGQLCNNFFFIIAGFLLLLHFNKALSFIDFIKHKAVRLLPVIIAMWGLYYLLSKAGIMSFMKYHNIFALLFLNNSGLTLEGNNIGGSWFVSVLVCVSCFYFYIYKHLPKYISDFITCMLTILCYSFLIHAFDGQVDINPLKNFYYVFNAGIMQGLACMGTGIILCNIYQEYWLNLVDKKETLISKIFYTAIEGYLFVFLFYSIIFHKINFKNEMIYILAFCTLFFSFLIKKGFLSKVLDCNFSKEIGKYTYSVFLVHGFVLALLSNFLWRPHYQFVCNHPMLQIFIAITTSFIGGILMYHLVEKPLRTFIK